MQAFFDWTNKVRDQVLKPLYLLVYRIGAFIVIMGSILFIVGWVWVMIFFMFNHTWLAPTVLSATSDRMLTFTSGYQQAYQNIETLKVTEAQAARDLTIARNNSMALHDLQASMESYVVGLEINGKRKMSDLTQSQILLDGLRKTEDKTRASLQAGLITAEEANQELLWIQQFRNTTTDGKMALETAGITAAAQYVTLQAQVAQADNDIQTKLDTLGAAERSLEGAQTVMNTLQATSYYAAMKTGANLAFVPYDNRNIAKIGAPVYDCYLVILACHQIGTIKAVFNDEQLVEFPLFNIKLSHSDRGFFVELDTTDQRAMGSTVFFVGKPLFL